MRVLYFSDTFLPKTDGVAVSIKNFSELLALRGHVFCICAPKYGDGDFDRMTDNIQVVRFRSGYLPSYPDIKVVLPSPGKIKRIIEDFKPDLIHIHTPGLLGLYAVNAAERFGVPTIGTYHTLMAEQEMYVSFYRLFKLDKLFFKANKFKKKLNIDELDKIVKFDNFNIRKKIILKICNDIYNRCDVVISPSHLIKEQLIEYGITRPITVVSNGMDLKRFQGTPKTYPGGDAPKFLHVGRISYEKNCDVVINAFKLIHEHYPNATLTVIGEGPAIPSLERQAEHLGIEKSVSFKGFIPNAVLHEEYPKYDVFLTASTMETQGLVVLEAIACGLPAVGVDAFALPELIRHGENGYIAKSFDAKGIAEGALSIIRNPLEYSTFSKNSIQIASGHEMEKCVDAMEEVYSKVVEAMKGKVKKSTIFDLFFDFMQ
ncbi:glycosyltransferase family 4 protein [Leptospira congkakensis]|uniref:Glycosyltransferase family 4 protein n=1 Tax=Leptospira congkakensis TaxID=2484932 RepID=A0A4Z1A977_9LEPT|nr:glycosyltransferase [Leptospira congkakensis]TGL87876.1 glycosyltransferase family 4 protein [Leptospira congkakensis]TGL92653.1 glycosyltransferase family 4 protein [Leptospira congkakensis]TGL96026.1 glycosyltransferase family 4 protein [Leptospira congkakensis]